MVAIFVASSKKKKKMSMHFVHTEEKAESFQH